MSDSIDRAKLEAEAAAYASGGAFGPYEALRDAYLAGANAVLAQLAEAAEVELGAYSPWDDPEPIDEWSWNEIRKARYGYQKAVSRLVLRTPWQPHNEGGETT